jgi:thioredoxin-like negative regulator of GroEL
MIREVTDRDFDRVVGRSTLPVLVQFWKPGCGHCRALARQLELLQQDVTGRLLILKMNVEENHQIPAECEISSLPALALFRQGQFERFVGGIGTREAILRHVLSPDR